MGSLLSDLKRESKRTRSLYTETSLGRWESTALGHGPLTHGLPISQGVHLGQKTS